MYKEHNYQFIVGYLNSRFRLIECRDHIQRILQRRDKNKERWRGISYFMFKKSMFRVLHEHGLETDLFDTLPERFESRFKAVQSEQRRIHEVTTAVRRKRARCQKFFNGLIVNFN